MQWFEVDRQGLAKVLARKGKEFVLHELISNAWDENVTRVDVTLARVPGSRNVRLIVADDSPEGFADLRHAFTLFAESAKRHERAVGKRGRFNLGDKLTLAVCESAEIVSTKGTVTFDGKGRTESRRRQSAGTTITAELRMTEDERRACDRSARRLLVPRGVTTTYNGEVLDERPVLATFAATLATEWADAEGNLRPTRRACEVAVVEPRGDEVPMLYELGVPVCECGTPWHLDVGQKVPLAMDRDSVSPAYLAKVRAAALDHMHDRLTPEQANGTWVRDAFEKHGHELAADTVQAVVGLRFGEHRVAYDPSDQEANSLAVSKGFVVVHGSQLSGAEWEAAKRVGAIQPAGRVTPSPKPFSPDGAPLRLLERLQWTPGMRWFERLAQTLASRLLASDLVVRIAVDPTWPFAGAYRDGLLHINAGRLGKAWFDGELADILNLLIHELGHHGPDGRDHLSEKYHDALTRLGGQIAALALSEPEIFQRAPGPSNA